MRRHVERGFTLIEILLVIVLISVLLAIATPMMMAYLERGRAASCLSSRYHTEKAELAYMLEKHASSDGFAALVDSGLIHREPVCPSGGVYVWIQRTPTPILGCSLHYGALSVEDNATVLFTSLFDDQSGLKKLMGNWNTSNGTLSNKPGQENRIAFGDPAWKDYEIRVSAELTQGAGYGIYFRADANPNITGYVFQYDPGLGNKFVVRKVVNGVEQSPFQSVSMPAGFNIFNASHDIGVSVVGNRTTIKVDNNTVLDFTDDTFTSGSGGFRTWGQSLANFDNLSVIQK